jgi:putative colanic acid biosynthesis UDP-glucose lipid carrier transferase
MRIADALVCIGAGLLAFVVRFGVRDVSDAYQAALGVAVLLVLLIFPLFRVYKAFRTRSIGLPSARTITAWLFVILTLMVLMVLVGKGQRFSRIWIAEWFGMGIFGFAGLRISVYAGLRLLRRTGRNMKRIALVGSGALAAEMRRVIATEKWMGYELAARYHETDDDSRSRAADRLQAFEERLKNHEVDEIWIAAALDQSALVSRICKLAGPYAITVRYAPDLRELFLLNQGITEVAGLPMIDLTSGPLQGINSLVKRIEDVVLGSIILIVASPPAAAIAIAVKLSSPGPIIFKQHRHGWDGRIIKVYKFRTMKPHDEGERLILATKDDKRVTSVGRFLRRTSLDELPQILNVLQGRMSLVGPRPHACQVNRLYQAQIEGFMLRHKMRPGITGWAQVNGWRGGEDTPEMMAGRVEHDLFYIEHWSVWFDLKILGLTLVHGFVSANAY